MCGIAGMVVEGSAQAFAGAAQQMARAIAHRGPDSHGVECIGPCALVNTRLAIIDLSARGRQPMSSDDGAVWITYNGETYNAAELRETLEQRGHRFRSTTDTEVVLHLYLEFGESCIQRLRGMFAFAVWDARSGKLVLARDRMGIKPLYYARTGRALLFASEIKALLASGLLPRKLDPAGLRAYLQLGHVPPPWTAIQQVQPLEPGHVATWQNGRWTSSAYWSLRGDLARSGVAPQSVGAELGEVLLDAMRKHLVSDVPILLFLSGGTDSACVAAAAREAGAGNLTAMTVGFAEEEFDESQLSRRTAEALGIPHRVVTLSAGQIGKALDHTIWAMDQPTIDGLNSYWISRLAAEAGFKVALSGQGGDELFGGYASHRWFARFDRMARWLHPLPARPFINLFDRDTLPFRWRKLSYLFAERDPFLASQLAVKVMFLDRDVRTLLAPPFAANGRTPEAHLHLAYWAKRVEKQGLKEKLSFMDIHTHLEPRLLRDMDAMSMAHSLEVRPVFLDHCLVEFLLPLPSDIRMHQKRLLLEATRRFLPEALHRDLLARPKRTFTFPFARWLSRELREEMQQTFAPERLRAAGVLDPGAVGRLWRRYVRQPESVGWSRIWNLFVLQRWCEASHVSP